MTPAFPDKAHTPTDAELLRMLGPSAALWSDLMHRLESSHGPLTREWKHYGKTSGWTLKVFKGKRNLFFVSPRAGGFTASFVLGDRAVAAVESSDLPASLVEALVTARRYAEGRGVRVDVQSAGGIADVATLTAIKLAH
jgi:hypothetical protein